MYRVDPPVGWFGNCRQKETTRLTNNVPTIHQTKSKINWVPLYPRLLLTLGRWFPATRRDTNRALIFSFTGTT